MLTRKEIDRRLAAYQTAYPDGITLDPVEAGEIRALETARQLGEWLRFARSCPYLICNDCEFDGSACDKRDSDISAWLSGESQGG
jgi:hypothetical protein